MIGYAKPCGELEGKETTSNEIPSMIHSVLGKLIIR